MRPNLIVEFLKSLVGLSRHSTGALGFTILKVTNCTITESKAKEYVKEGEVLKKNILVKTCFSLHLNKTIYL